MQTLREKIVIVVRRPYSNNERLLQLKNILFICALRFFPHHMSLRMYVRCMRGSFFCLCRRFTVSGRSHARGGSSTSRRNGDTSKRTQVGDIVDAILRGLRVDSDLTIEGQRLRSPLPDLIHETCRIAAAATGSIRPGVDTVWCCFKKASYNLAAVGTGRQPLPSLVVWSVGGGS